MIRIVSPAAVAMVVLMFAFGAEMGAGFATGSDLSLKTVDGAFATPFVELSVSDYAAYEDISSQSGHTDWMQEHSALFAVPAEKSPGALQEKVFSTAINHLFGGARMGALFGYRYPAWGPRLAYAVLVGLLIYYSYRLYRFVS